MDRNFSESNKAITMMIHLNCWMRFESKWNKIRIRSFIMTLNQNKEELKPFGFWSFPCVSWQLTRNNCNSKSTMLTLRSSCWRYFSPSSVGSGWLKKVYTYSPLLTYKHEKAYRCSVIAIAYSLTCSWMFHTTFTPIISNFLFIHKSCVKLFLIFDSFPLHRF